MTSRLGINFGIKIHSTPRSSRLWPGTQAGIETKKHVPPDFVDALRQSTNVVVLDAQMTQIPELSNVRKKMSELVVIQCQNSETLEVFHFLRQLRDEVVVEVNLCQ